MRRTGILLAVALLATLWAPIGQALPPCDCHLRYTSCCDSIWSTNQTISQAQKNLCASMEANCWNNCQGTNLTYCTQTYDYWEDGVLHTGKNFEAFATASYSDNEFYWMTSHNSCW